MKTRHLFLATIFLSLFVSNGHGHSIVKFNAAKKNSKTETPGSMESPVKTGSPDTVFVIAAIQPQTEENQDLYMRQFDISTMSAPEAEVDEWGIDTRWIFQMIMLEQGAGKH